MTSGNMPNPPDHLTTQATSGDVQGQATASVPGESNGSEQVVEPMSLGADMARILEEDVDVLAQQMVYHSQMMFGVSAMGTDPVNARNSVMVIANALRNEASGHAIHALSKLGEPQITQVNDRTLPFRMGLQVAGLLEGLLADSISRAYKEDVDKQREARALLEAIFQEANERTLAPSNALMTAQAPGPGPNARQ